MRKEKTNRWPRTWVWALLTIIAFPIVLLMASQAGMGILRSFLFGMLASLVLLALNGLTERRLWLFDPSWRARFDRPDFSFRLAVVSGAVLLIVETIVLVMLFSDRSLDRALTNMVLGRECAAPTPEFVDLCNRLTNR